MVHVHGIRHIPILFNDTQVCFDFGPHGAALPWDTGTTHKSEHPFMQGGAGYVLSHEALRRVWHYIEAHRASLDKWMETEWAGDISLGAVLNESAVPLT